MQHLQAVDLLGPYKVFWACINGLQPDYTTFDGPVGRVRASVANGPCRNRGGPAETERPKRGTEMGNLEDADYFERIQANVANRFKEVTSFDGNDLNNLIVECFKKDRKIDAYLICDDPNPLSKLDDKGDIPYEEVFNPRPVVPNLFSTSLSMFRTFVGVDNPDDPRTIKLTDLKPLRSVNRKHFQRFFMFLLTELCSRHCIVPKTLKQT